MLLDDLLKEACEFSATDVYLIVGAVPCMSIEGRFMAPKCSRGQRLTPEAIESFAREMMTEAQWDEFLDTREANLAYMKPEIGRFRVNVLMQRGSLGMVLRRVVMEIPTMRELGLSPVLRNIALADRGIVLVTGSTGCGKSTTMASMIDYRNHLRTGHIVTIEDPIEFVYQHRRSVVTQREVGMDTLSFEEALRNSMRQSPQVISIGELRDASTVEFALHAAETGHLVFATLHSTNAILALERVMHFFPPTNRELVRLQLALNFRAIICQRLPRAVDGGRACAAEVLMNTPRIQDLLRKDDFGGIAAVLAGENNDGMLDFDRALYKLARRGIISPEEALTHSDSSSNLQMKFRGIGIEAGSSWEDLDDPWQYIDDDYEPPPNFTGPEFDPDGAGAPVYTNENAPPMSAKSVAPLTSRRTSASGVHRLPSFRTKSAPPPAAPPEPPPPKLPLAGAAGGTAPKPAPPTDKTPPPPPAPPRAVVDRYRDMINDAVKTDNSELDSELDADFD